VRLPGRPISWRALYASERARFLVVGGFNTAFGYFLFAVLVLLGAGRVHYTLLLVAAYAAATVVAYLLHRTIVFRVKGNLVRDFPRYVSVHLGALAANLALLPLLVELVGMHVLAAQWLLVAVMAVATYLGHKRFSFRRPAPAPSLPHDAAPRPGP
jgi:putative flippase GtrA